jgi:hypothetical protein
VRKTLLAVILGTVLLAASPSIADTPPMGVPQRRAGRSRRPSPSQRPLRRKVRWLRPVPKLRVGGSPFLRYTMLRPAPRPRRGARRQRLAEDGAFHVRLLVHRGHYSRRRPSTCPRLTLPESAPAKPRLRVARVSPRGSRGEKAFIGAGGVGVSCCEASRLSGMTSHSSPSQSPNLKRSSPYQATSVSSRHKRTKVRRPWASRAQRCGQDRHSGHGKQFVGKNVDKNKCSPPFTEAEFENRWQCHRCSGRAVRLNHVGQLSQTVPLLARASSWALLTGAQRLDAYSPRDQGPMRAPRVTTLTPGKVRSLSSFVTNTSAPAVWAVARCSASGVRYP